MKSNNKIEKKASIDGYEFNVEINNGVVTLNHWTKERCMQAIEDSEKIIKAEMSETVKRTENASIKRHKAMLDYIINEEAKINSDNEDENDPNVKMMADIIYFIKNGQDIANMTLHNTAIGVDVDILKDYDFFDVSVHVKGKKRYCSDSFSVEIEDFTEVFDFIWGSIDELLAKA